MGAEELAASVRLDPIVIRAYDEAWPVAFERERERLTPVFDQWLVRRVEHIGSTAVPRLAAKAIIDILAVVGNVDSVRPVIGRVHEIGWHYAPEPGDEADRYLAFCTPSVARRTHHLHVVEERSGGVARLAGVPRSPATPPRHRCRVRASQASSCRRTRPRPERPESLPKGKAEFIRRVTTLALEEALSRT